MYWFTYQVEMFVYFQRQRLAQFPSNTLFRGGAELEAGGSVRAIGV